MKASTKRRFPRTGLLPVLLGSTVLFVGVLLHFMPGFSDGPPDVRERADIESIIEGLNSYKAMNGFLPTTAQGIEALITKPNTEPKSAHWRQLFTGVPLDAWNHPYFYEIPGKHNPDSFDVYSAGPDGKPGTADDIGNW